MNSGEGPSDSRPYLPDAEFDDDQILHKHKSLDPRELRVLSPAFTRTGIHVNWGFDALSHVAIWAALCNFAFLGPDSPATKSLSLCTNTPRPRFVPTRSATPKLPAHTV